ncbi:MAG TPA: methyltransferase domain-containing protein [Pyrinomonadaceae bacterium]|nr:methyltransferase domain-containing protein [Pyrinomonadaceae bacterium]
MIETDETEVDISHLMARIREAAAERKAHNGTSVIDASAILHELLKSNGSLTSAPTTQISLSESTLAQPSALQQLRIPPLSLQPEFEAHSDDRYHVNDLLKFHDREFVRNAYRAILKREPDDAGYAEYVENLRSGRFNKIDILASLRFSPEGRGKAVELEGLTFPAFVRRLYRVPVVGYLIEWTISILRVPMLLRSQRQFESHTIAQQERLAHQINLVSERMASALDALSQRDAEWQDHLSEVNRSLSGDLNRVGAQLLEDFAKVVDEIAQSHKKVSALHHQKIGGLFREQQAIVEDQEKMRADMQEYLLSEQERSRQQAQLLETYDARLNEAKAKYEALMNQVTQRLQQTRAELVMQERRLSLLLEEARKRLPETLAPEQLETFADEGSHVLDVLYASFEDEFRGSRQDIKDRFKVYLPILKDAGITDAIVDLGCGRGEWLEVLKEEGFEALGVETNRAMIEQCRERALEVTESDAITYLQGLPRESLRAVTGLHFIEHLPFETLIKLLDEVVRVLKPGGLAIFETPNPENIMVSSYNFYLDPTHRNPLPGPMARFLLESRGLSRVRVMMLNPLEHKIEGEGELILRFNDLFFGPRDYAVVGQKV